MGHLDDRNIYKALSAPVRRSLLELIETRGPIDLKSLTGDSRIKETTLRHHLMVLERAGLIVSEEGHEGVPGRPPLVYRVPQRHWDLSFPRRQYAMLAEKLLTKMLTLMGPAETRSLMEQIGREAARGILAEQLAKRGGEHLDIDDIGAFLIPALNGLGSAATLSEVSENLIRIKMTNCIYYELAVKYEEVICRGHEAFFETVAEALDGDFEVSTEACLACGDDCCISTISRKGADDGPE